jgi:hypothetical protein
VSYTICLIGGAAIGLFFGDMAFPGLEALIGDLYEDILLGSCGAVIGALAHEVVATFWRLR